MKAYIGTKVIQAEPKRDDHGRDGYTVVYGDGYRSWSPKEVFDAAYQLFDAMSFGHALRMLQDGKRVTRAGWNGKGMWLRLYNPHSDGEFGIRELHPARNITEVDSGTLRPWVGMRTADGFFVPWVASQTDLLANDWQVVG